MKKLLGVLCVVLLFTGCGGKSQELEQAMGLRARLLASQGCSFDATITADYGDELHTFAMSCESDNRGNVSFSVTAPESIAGITGKVDGEGGKLTFDDKALHFDLMADNQITPVSGPWILMKTLLGGYITSCGMDGEYLRLAVDDSYEDDALHLDIWLNEDDKPVRGEIFFDSRRIVTLELQNFRIQ